MKMSRWIAGSLVCLAVIAAAAGCLRWKSPLGEVERLTSDASRLARYHVPYYVAVSPLPNGGLVAAWMKRDGDFQTIVSRWTSGPEAPFSEEQYLSSEAYRKTISLVPSLYRDPVGGMLWATWQARFPSTGNKSILVRRSEDDGKTWSQETVVNSVATSFIPALTGDGRGGVAVAWPDERQTGSLQIYANRSIDRGNSWLPSEVRLDDPARGNASDVSLVSDGAGGIVAVWAQRTTSRAVMAAVSKDQGASWSTPVRIDDGSPMTSPVDPRVAVADGHVVVTWTAARTGPRGRSQVWADVSFDGGTSWGTDALLHEVQEGVHARPQVLAVGRTAHVTFSVKGAVYHTAFRGDGAWSSRGAALEPLVSGGGDYHDPELGEAGSGHVELVYVDREARILLRTSDDDGATWGPPTVVYERENERNGLHYPQVTGTGEVAYVVWEQWGMPEHAAATLAEVGKIPIPVDLFVRRIRRR